MKPDTPVKVGVRLSSRAVLARGAAAWLLASALGMPGGMAFAATVTYTQQQNQYDTRWDSGGGTYDTGGSTELGMWAGGDQGYTVAWKTFRTASATSSSARELQVGDEFTIRVYTYGCYYGEIGVSLNDGGSTGAPWANRVSGSRMSVRQDGGNYGSGGGIGSWYAIGSGAGESFTNTPAGSSGADYTVKVKVTSSSTFNVDLNGKTKYDWTMAGSPATSARIDAYSIFLNDDRRYQWDAGDNRKDSFWKQTTQVQDTGALEFGGDGVSRSIGGLITDGLAADSTSTVRTNRLVKIGAGTMTLGVTTNTYTGGSQVENGILQGSADRCFGIVAASPSTNHFDIWSSGTLQFTASFALDANRGIALGTVATPKIGVSSGAAVSYGGSMVGSANWQKVGDGTLTLTGISSNTGVANIPGGMLAFGQDQAAGAAPGGAAENINVWSTGTLGFTNVFTLAATRSIELGAVHGPRIWVAPASTATVSGAIQGSANWTNIGPGTLVLSNNTFSGSLTITQGVVCLVHSNAMGTTAAGTVVGSGGELQLKSPGNYTNEALTITGTGVAGGGALRKVDSTGRAYAGTITLGGDAKIAVDAGGLFPSAQIDLAGNTLTVDATASFQMLSGSSLANATKTAGSGALVKSGSSYMILRPSSDLTGSITLSGGELRIGPNVSGSGLVAGGTLTMAAGTKLSADSTTTRTVAKNVVINGGVGLAENSTGGLTLSGTVGLGAGMRVVTNSNAVTITGVISDGGLEKKGAGTMILLGTNTYAGGTTVSAGTLQGHAAGLQGAITNNSAVVFDQVTTGTYAGVMSGTGTLTKQADGAVILTASNSYNGATAINAGILAQNGTNTASAVTVAAGATLMGGGRVSALTVNGTVRPNPNAAARARLRVASLTMNDGSAGRFRLGDASDTSDRDFIENDGAATINATTTIYVEDSQLSNFNSGAGYSWNLIVGGIADAANFTVNTNTYWSTDTDGGAFTLGASGGNLVLTFTPNTSEPTVQATTVAFSVVGVTSMTVGWTPGNGANRVVVAHAGAAVDDDPDDAVPYAADPNFGDGAEIGTGNFVVYNGSGSSVPVTGLSADTVYHFRVYEYNGSGGSENYNTNAASGNPASQTTLDDAPTAAATALAITAVDSTTMSLGWTRGDGANVLLVGRSGAAAEEPTDGTTYAADPAWGSAGAVGAASKALYLDSGTSEDLTGLSAETLYHFAAFELNGSGGSENYLTAGAPVTNLYTLSTEPSAHAGSFAATAVSKSQIDLSWSAAAGADAYMILIRQGTDPAGTPTDGRAYVVGDTFGSDTVTGLVAGTSFSAYNLSPNTQYNFSIIPYNWDASHAQTYNYRTAATIPTANDTTWARASRVIKESFNSYADFNNLAGANGGTGWEGAWSGAWDEGDIWIDDLNFSVSLQLLPAQEGDYTRKAKFDVDSNGKRSAIKRQFEAITSGQLYAMWIMQGGENNASRFWGVSFGTNANYGFQAFGVGKTRNDGLDLGISIPNLYSNQTVQTTDWDLNAGNPYLIAIKYDFDTDLLQVKAWYYTVTDIFSMQEPGPTGVADGWDMERSIGGIDKLDYLFLEAGSADAGGNAGECFFDHIRIGTNWYETMVLGGEDDPSAPVPPTAALVYIGTNYSGWDKSLTKTNVYDGELANTNDPIDFAVRWTDATGMFVTNDPSSVQNISGTKGRVSPNWDPLSIGAATNAFGFDRVFTNFYGNSGDGSVTSYQYSAFSVTNLDIDAYTYYITLGGENEDQSSGEYTADPPAGGQDTYGSRGILVNEPLRFYVFDDDTNAPALADIYSVSGIVATLRDLHITVGTSNTYSSGDTTNRVFRTADGNLAALSDSNPLRLSLGATDPSGVSRGSMSTSWNMSVTIGSVIQSNKTEFSADESSPLAAAGLTTNVWRFNSLTYNQIGDLFTAHTNKVEATVPDADMDRVNDQMVLTNQQYGLFAVYDDDVLGPALGDITVVGAAASGSAILQTGFEASEGWPIQGSGEPWDIPITNGLGTGVWHGTGYVNIGDPRSGVRKGGMTVAGVGQYFELPARDNPGTLSVYARLSSAGASRELAVERWDGAEWTGCGTNTVTSDSYQRYDWDVDWIENGVTLRLVRVGTDGSPGIFLDDLELISADPIWLSATAITSFWNAAVDASGVYEYRAVAPSYSASEPSQMTDGTSLGAGTQNVFNVAGCQGVLTGFVFSVDDDNDRANDRTNGNNSAFLVRIDTNPPPVIANVTAIEGEDPTSEAIVQWTAATNAGERAAPSYAVLSAWDTYRVYYTDDETEPTTGSPYVDKTYDAALTNMSVTNVTVTNLIFDTTYKFRVAGRDQAGNLGPLSDTFTIVLPGFNVTQGMVQVGSGGIRFPEIYWKAATNASGGVSREYDLLFADAISFSDSLSNQWALVESGWTNALPDTGDVARAAPTLMVDTMRFFRAASADRWLIDRSPRVASEEVYGMKTVWLYPGQNWIGLSVIPDSNTLQNVLGHELPAGSMYTDPDSTIVSWYNRASNEVVKKDVWLLDWGASNQWRTGTGWGGLNQPADYRSLPTDEGFVVVIPTNTSETRLMIHLGRVPTNIQEQVIEPHAYNLVNMRVPAKLKPSQMNLVESGFQGGPNSLISDRLRKLNRELKSTGRDVWYNTTEQKWYYAGAGLADDFYITPDDGFLIWTRASASAWTWTNALPYSAPTRLMNP
ncbi:MAG TPA: autotransporter-associated beta strand repeat-containing protein [Kiritimatiellia bacterium]|nr:autotransporter-associated beta strand repeat-containing protein [Kiritimatiellia bacterium]